MMTQLQLPISFEKSYQAHKVYPQNLVSHMSYADALEAYKCLLDERVGRLCVNDDVDVPFRDWSGNGE